jgi:hypothetical protein
MDDQKNDTNTFSAEYVRELRSENAQWRTKLREMESKYGELENKMNSMNTKTTVASELLKRGVKANPDWIKPQEGQSVGEAIDNFLNEYPQFAVDQQAKPEPARPNIPKSSRSEPKTNVPTPGERSITEVRDDPKARSEVRDLYRQMLTGKNNTL